VDPTSSPNKETIIAIKTFSDGVSLPASDINTYLTNAGLVYVSSTTVGTAVATVTVSNAFSSTYDSYKIIYTGGTGTGVINMYLGASLVSYSNVLVYGNTYAAPTPGGIGASASTNWQYVGWCDANICSFNMEISSPNLAKYTTFTSAGYAGATNAGSGAGIHAVATAYTSFTLFGASTFTGGTITVYGYRKA
jgi:hypothetical protein